jgi:hypothetical protein
MSQHKNTLDFTAALERFEGVGTWTFLTVPFDAETIFGKKRKERREKSPSCRQSTMGLLFHIRVFT